MPPLSNPRHERFAQALAKGNTQTEAYIDAGYVPNRKNASRLMKTNEDIQKRLSELFDATIPEIQWDRKALNNVYSSLLIEAKAQKNLAIAKGIADSIAKVNGLVVTRHETGKAGDFDNLSDSELIDIIAQPLGESLDVENESREDDE